MRVFYKSALISILIFMLLASPAVVQGIPPLPSSIYGTVKLNGNNVPDGTLVEALINKTVFATGTTRTYENISVYSVDIPGDEAGTTAVEGGSDGETITFRVGGAMAKETGTWHSGTNVRLDLTVQSSAPVNTPAPTASPRPTQTAIVIYPTNTAKVIYPTVTVIVVVPTQTTMISSAAVTPTLNPSLIFPRTQTPIAASTGTTGGSDLPEEIGTQNPENADANGIEKTGFLSKFPLGLVVIIPLLLVLLFIGYKILPKIK